MRVCESCGRENEDRNRFCVWCGKSFLEEIAAEAAVREAAPYGELVTPEENLPAEGPAEEKPAYSMRWHKFLMVLLVIGGIWTIGKGIAVLTDTWYEVYDVDPDLIYRFYPALKTLNWILGVVTVALGVFKFTVRKRLKNFMESGPRSLMALYGVSIGISVLYLLAASVVMGVPLSVNQADWVNIAASVCMMFAQKKYYDRRSELFVN